MTIPIRSISVPEVKISNNIQHQNHNIELFPLTHSKTEEDSIPLRFLTHKPLETHLFNFHGGKKRFTFKPQFKTDSTPSISPTNNQPQLHKETFSPFSDLNTLQYNSQNIMKYTGKPIDDGSIFRGITKYQVSIGSDDELVDDVAIVNFDPYEDKRDMPVISEKPRFVAKRQDISRIGGSKMTAMPGSLIPLDNPILNKERELKAIRKPPNIPSSPIRDRKYPPKPKTKRSQTEKPSSKKPDSPIKELNKQYNEDLFAKLAHERQRPDNERRRHTSNGISDSNKNKIRAFQNRLERIADEEKKFSGIDRISKVIPGPNGHSTKVSAFTDKFESFSDNSGGDRQLSFVTAMDYNSSNNDISSISVSSLSSNEQENEFAVNDSEHFVSVADIPNDNDYIRKHFRGDPTIKRALPPTPVATPSIRANHKQRTIHDQEMPRSNWNSNKIGKFKNMVHVFIRSIQMPSFCLGVAMTLLITQIQGHLTNRHESWLRLIALILRTVMIWFSIITVGGLVMWLKCEDIDSTTPATIAGVRRRSHYY